MHNIPAQAAPQPREFYGIQSLRGFAAWMVVIDHAALWQSKYFPHVSIFPSSTIVGEFGVDLFFVISGFIMTYITPRAFLGWRDQGAFLIRRFLRIYPAYWAVTILLLIVWLFDPNAVNNSQNHQVNVLATLLLLPSKISPILVVAWTLIYEIYFYCVASVIFYFSGKWRLVMMSAWFLVIVLCNVAHPLPFASPCWNIWLSTLSLEFIAGMFLAHFLQRVSLRIVPFAAGLIVISALLFAFYYGSRHGSYAPGFYSHWRLLVYGVPALITLWMVLQMEIQNEWGSLIKLGVWLGDRSYSTYLLHVPVLAAFLMLASKVMKNASGTEVFFATVAAALFLVVPVEVCYRVVEKPSHLLAKKWAKLARATSRPASPPRPDVVLGTDQG